MNQFFPHLQGNVDKLLLCRPYTDECSMFMGGMFMPQPGDIFELPVSPASSLAFTSLPPLAFSGVERIFWRDIIQPTTTESRAPLTTVSGLLAEDLFPQMHSFNYTVKIRSIGFLHIQPQS